MAAYIQEMAVNRFKWLDDNTFNEGVALCQAIPGATAIQVAAYVGLKTRGVSGSLLSFVGFGLPAFVLMLLLSIIYVRFSNLQRAVALFAGLKVIVVAIVMNAAVSFGRGCLKDWRDVTIALGITLLYWGGASPFIVLVVAGMTAVLLLKEPTPGAYDRETGNLFHVKQVAFLLSVLLAAFLLLSVLNRKLFELALLMMKVDLFAFGGGFASLPLLLNQVVEVKGWLDGKTFMDGIALGQVTPGPIVITATLYIFWFFWRNGGNLSHLYPIFFDTCFE
jgi:chromate transporter